MTFTVSRPVCGALVLAAIALASCRQSPTTTPKTITSKSGIKMVLVPAGMFEMGSTSGPADEAPPHMVLVNHPFLMDATEVTQAQYTALAVVNPSHYKGDDLPVEQVSWAKAVLYCNLRSKAEGLDPCYDEETAQCDFEASGYRLPTEAEWEYACRARGASDAPRPADAAWYAENSGKTTHPVGQKQPNAWGLYDMLGNVAEWCNDVYDPAYYKGAGYQENPRGPAEGKLYVLRGGAWNSKAEACRPTARAGEYPGFQDACFARDAIGFRCVRRPGPAE